MSRFQGSRTPPFPATLHLEIRRAHRRAQELASKDRELHFTSDASGRLVVEVRTLDGRVLGAIAAATALEIINGVDLEEALRASAPGNDSPPTPPAAV